MKTTRQGVFETNSSSTHSLTIADGGELIKQPFSDADTRAGVVKVYADEFGWEVEEFRDVETKLSYLYTDAMRSEKYADKEGVVDPNTYESTKLDILREAVKQVAGLGIEFCARKDFYPFGYIDHESEYLPNEVWSGGLESVIKFIFNPHSVLRTDNDNR